MTAHSLTDKNAVPLVSVIMATYNKEKYLPICLEAVRRQTFSNWEMIVVNDASDDSTPQILEVFSESNAKKIRYINSGKAGIGASLNLALSYAKGKYIAILDDDDNMFPDRLLKQVNFLGRNEDIGVVGSAAILINDQGDRIGKKINPENDKEIKGGISVFNSPVIHSSAMVRTSLLRAVKYREALFLSPDLALWKDLSVKTRFYNLPEPLMYKRIYRKSATGNARTARIIMLANLQYITNELWKDGRYGRMMFYRLKMILIQLSPWFVWRKWFEYSYNKAYRPFFLHNAACRYARDQDE